MGLTEQEQSERTAILEAQSARALKREADREKQELHALRLVEKYEATGLVHGEDFCVFTLSRGGHVVAVRAPTPDELTVSNGEPSVIVRTVLLHPTHEEWAAIESKVAGAKVSIIRAVNSLVASARSAAGKEL